MFVDVIEHMDWFKRQNRRSAPRLSLSTDRAIPSG
jgi:hypothetical protein